MTQSTFKSSRLLLPPRPWYIYATLGLGLIGNLATTGPLSFLPDWLAMVICFWSIREFRKVGMGTAFVLGVLMDVADASMMGQHALAYVLVAYLSSSLSRRIMWFPLQQQALHVLPILLLAQLVQFAVRMIGGGDFPGFGYFVGPLLATLLWVPGTYLMMLPQFRAADRDENRPI
jgi:rod shape-determining protein MreD